MDQVASPETASFRDPAGFLFAKNNTLYRQINSSGLADFEHYISSGLHAALRAKGLVVDFSDAEQQLSPDGKAAKIIRPALVPFISYPYEWCFSELKNAALLTLTLAETALSHGMLLKDASAYNVQFLGSQPIFIDTLSFERYRVGAPWVAYRQFCQHFLAPLMLMAHRHIGTQGLLRANLDGLPLDLTSRLLRACSWFSPAALMHIHLHASAQKRYSSSESSSRARAANISEHGVRALLDSLRSAITRLTWNPQGTEWAEYYDHTNYSNAAQSEKGRLVSELLKPLQYKMVWDLGANDGTYTRLAIREGATTIGFDIDPSAVEKNFRREQQSQGTQLLPLVMDLTNPSPSLGWAHQERASMVQRGPADVVLALALIHHLAISNNTPLERIASFFAQCGHSLIVEFVPKEDSQTKKLLSSRPDIFPEYHRDGFEKAFAHYFTVAQRHAIPDSQRTLYLMHRKV